MNRRGLLAGIIAFSLMTGTAAFAADTAPAAPTGPAAEVAPAPAVAAAAPAAIAPVAAATPLAPRPTKPLTLAPKDEGTPFGYKLLAGLGLAAAAGLWFHKKKKDAYNGEKKKKPASRIDILSRQSVGVRNELLVVDVEGTRLLVGMTPGAMQTLAVLDTPDSTTEVNDEVKETAAERTVTERIAQPAPARAAYDSIDDEEEELPPVSFVPSKPRATTSVSALDQKVRSLLANRPAPVQSTPSTVVPKRRRGNNPSKTARIAGQAKGLLLAMSDDAETPARTGEM